MATNALTFAYDEALQSMVSAPVTPGEEGAVTIALSTEDVETHKLGVQHSINGEDWQWCGQVEFSGGHVEATVDGLRAGLQQVRFAIFGKANVTKAEYV